MSNGYRSMIDVWLELFCKGLLQQVWWSYMLERKSKDSGWLNTLICRFRGHPTGMIYFNPAPVIDPDYRCANCFDEL